MLVIMARLYFMPHCYEMQRQLVAYFTSTFQRSIQFTSDIISLIRTIALYLFSFQQSEQMCQSTSIYNIIVQNIS